MTQSIKTNQTVSGEFDLSNFVGQGSEATPQHKQPTVAKRPTVPKRTKKTEKAQPKAVAEKKVEVVFASERIQLRLTAPEMDKLKKQADGRPLGPYVRTLLKEKHLI